MSSVNDYLAKKPQREFMANIARDVNNVDWMAIQCDCQEPNDMVYSQEYKNSIMSRLLTLTQEQSIRILLRVIESQKLDPEFKDYPDSVMSKMLEFDQCHFDF